MARYLPKALLLAVAWVNPVSPSLFAAASEPFEAELPSPGTAATGGVSPSADEAEPASLPSPLLSDPVLPPQTFPSIPAITRFEFRGNKIFSSKELQDLLFKYKHPFPGTDEDIETGRLLITSAYVKLGYINSGALLQSVSGGTVTFRIIEGQLTSVEVGPPDCFWLSQGWIRQDIRLAAGNPLNYNRLREELQLLSENPLLTRINANLEPGYKPGESRLIIDVRERQPFEASVVFSNNRPPSVGSGSVAINLTDLSLLRLNDPLSISWIPIHTTSDNFSHGWEYGGNENYGGSYSIPFTPWGTRLGIHGSHSDSAIIEQPFDVLNITSRLAEYGFDFNQPIFKKLSWSLGVSVGLEKDYSKTFLLGEPFDVNPGSVNGVSDVTMIPVTVDGMYRDQNQVWSFRNTLNIGLTALGATKGNGPGPDSNFISWVTQSQYTCKLINDEQMSDDVVSSSLARSTLLARLSTQISNNQLLSLEQFSMGGVESVRGYPENDLLRDNGVFASLELHFPLYTLARSAKKGERPQDPLDVVTLAPFFDVATGWNEARAHTVSPTAQEQTLTGLGIGLLVHPTPFVEGTFYWGHGFERDFVEGSNLQSEGIYFSLTIRTP